MRWIVTDNIYSETWRNLLEFSNLEILFDEIVRRHGIPNTKTKANYEKQAKQARVCVLQAKEYFDAARSSTLYTSPNHAYYGAIALASLTMLVIGDGRFSLDLLRRDNLNNHHGLDFTTGCNAKSAASGTTLLQNSHAKILKHGHFPNWYEVLPKTGLIHAIVRTNNESSSRINYSPVGEYRAPKFDEIVGKNKALIDLLKYLPDLNESLSRYGITTHRSRTNLEVTRNTDGTATFMWRIHGVRSAEEREALLERFRIDGSNTELISWKGIDESFSGVIQINFNKDFSPKFEWPSSRDTLNHDTISYANIEETHEIVDLYLLAYQLSMLSRYFPDIWISCIESQCRAAKLIERAIEIIIKKLPILTLSILYGEETVISTHREPWKI